MHTQRKSTLLMPYTITMKRHLSYVCISYEMPTIMTQKKSTEVVPDPNKTQIHFTTTNTYPSYITITTLLIQYLCKLLEQNCNRNHHKNLYYIHNASASYQIQTAVLISTQNHVKTLPTSDTHTKTNPYTLQHLSDYLLYQIPHIIIWLPVKPVVLAKRCNQRLTQSTKQRTSVMTLP